MALLQKKNSSSDNSCPSREDTLDLLGLNHDIAKLKAALKQKQFQSAKTAKELECELKRINDLEEMDEKIYSVVIVANDEASETNRISIDGAVVETENHQRVDSGVESTMQTEITFDSIGNLKRDKLLLHERQKRWQDDRDAKRKEALMQRQTELEESLTGHPVVKNTNQSWAKAKKEHDENQARAMEEEARQQHARELRERSLQELKTQEIKRMQDEYKKNKRELAIQLDKKKQDIYLNKLSRPRNQDVVKKTVEGSQWDTLYEVKQKNQPLKEKESDTHSLDQGEVRPQGQNQLQKPELSYAEMDDEEFARSMKAFSVQKPKTRVGKRKKVTNFSALIKTINQTSQRQRRKKGSLGRKSMEKSRNGDHVQILDFPPLFNTTIPGSEQNEKKIVNSAEGLTKSDSMSKHGGRFISSAAQAKILSELTRYGLQVDNDKISIDDIMNERHTHLEKQKVELEQRECYQLSQKSEVEISAAKEDPYERYEAGKVPFFGISSSAELGRFRVRDARGFVPESMRSIPVHMGDKCDGVKMLVGSREGEDVELTITITFERSKFIEDEAIEWWKLHRQAFIS